MSEPQHPRNILLLCPDVITERMAGPAIRYWEFARVLAADHHVTLAMANEPPAGLPVPARVRLVRHHEGNIGALCESHDVIVVQGVLPRLYPALRTTDKILVADLYDPVPLETLEQYPHMPWDEALPYQAEQVEIINTQLKYADYFLCAGERQRDLWLGALLSLGRINPFNYRDMATRVLSVPFGIPDAPPQRTGPGLREELDGFILLWGGGIWEWFDPLTVIRAVHRLRDEQPDLKLVFLGTQHPNPGIAAMPMQQRAEDLARELGLWGERVIFRPGWVPYDQLQNYLLDSDVGVSAHFDTLETRYAFRTRMLYYWWAHKPVITSTGDILAAAVAQHGAGIVVPPQDEDAWVAALRKLREPAFYNSCRAGAQQLATQYAWSHVTRPLQALCANPRGIADIARNPLENRNLKVRDWAQRCEALHAQIEELLTSTSWRVTAPLRRIKSWWRSMRRGEREL